MVITSGSFQQDKFWSNGVLAYWQGKLSEKHPMLQAPTFKAPNYNIQITNKFQILNSNDQNLFIPHLCNG